MPERLANFLSSFQGLRQYATKINFCIYDFLGVAQVRIRKRGEHGVNGNLSRERTARLRNL